MKLSSKKKKTASTYMIVGLVGLTVLSAGLGVGLKLKTDSYNQLSQEANANKQIVYVATREIKAGETLYDAISAPSEEEVNVEVQNVYTGLDSSLYMTDAQIGQTARLDMAAGVPILSVMATDASDITADVREVEIAVAQLMVDQMVGDYVDVRISFPDGTDEIVLSKKKVEGLTLETSTWHSQLNEAEIITLTSAIIDAAVLQNGHIYTVRYTEPTIQDAATPTYTVNPVAIDLINSDPNVVEKATETLNLQARLALQERLAQVDEQYAEMVGNSYAEVQQMHENAEGTEGEDAEAQTDGSLETDVTMDGAGTNGTNTREGAVNDVVDETIGTQNNSKTRR